MTWAAVTCSVLAVLVLLPGPPRRRRPPSSGRDLPVRPIAAIGAGLAGWGFVGGPAGLVAGVVTAGAAWWVLARAEPGHVRRDREAVQRDLPHLVDLLASTLRAGAEPVAGLESVCRALPGPAASRLAVVTEQARWGASAAEAWGTLADDAALAPLARAMARSEASGASVIDVVEHLADELEREASAAAEDAARRVGVAAAVPLGVCLLPAFLLIGVVPTVAVLMTSISP